MGDTKLADIPGAVFNAPLGSFASRASNADGIQEGSIGPVGFRQATELLSVDVFAISASKASAASGGANTLSVINLGSDGDGTTVLASVLLSASQDVYVPIAVAMVGTPAVAANEMIGVSQASGTAGGTTPTTGMNVSYKLT